MKKLIVFLVTITNIVCTYAQSIPVRTERDFSLKVYRMLDAYELSSSVNDEDTRANFIQLFSSSNLEIYNDLMGLSDAEYLSVDEYSKLLLSKVKSSATSVEIKNVRKGSIVDNGDAWMMPVSFEKEMIYSNNCGILLSNKDYYHNDYHLEAVFMYDKSTHECKINKLDGGIITDVARFPVEYDVFQQTSDRDKDVKVNGDSVSFNRYHQAIVPKNASVHYKDQDVVMKVVYDDPDCNLFHMKYTPKHWRVKPYVEFSMGDYFKSKEDVNSPLNNNINKETCFGLDLGYFFPSKGSVKVGMFAGIAFSKSKFGLTTDDFSYNYLAPSSADMDGDTYYRYYQLSNVEQSLKLTDLVVPFYFDFDFRFSHSFSLFLDLGIKAHFNLNKKTVTSLTSDTHGVYPAYDNLLIAETWLNNFGSHQLNESNSNPDLKINTVVDAFAGVGFRMKIYGPISVEAGLRYQYGFMDYIKNDDEPLTLNSGSILESSAFVTYTVDGGEKVNDLTKAFSSVKHNALKLNVGLTYKF